VAKGATQTQRAEPGALGAATPSRLRGVPRELDQPPGLGLAKPLVVVDAEKLL